MSCFFFGAWSHPIQWTQARNTGDMETRASCYAFWSSALFFQVHPSWPTQPEGGFSLCLKNKKCPRVCRDDLQFSPAEADRMRLWAVPPPSMLPLFKMKRKPRKGRTTRTEMCLAVSATELHSRPPQSRPFVFAGVSNCSVMMLFHVTGEWVKGQCDVIKIDADLFTLDSFIIIYTWKTLRRTMEVL